VNSARSASKIKTRIYKTRSIGLLSKLGSPTEPYEIMSIYNGCGFLGNKSPKKYLHVPIDRFSRAVFVSQKSGDIIKLIISVARKENIKTL